MENFYSQKLLEHFRNPHNWGRIKNPDGKGEVGNIVCGDVMHLYIKVKKDKKGKEKIEDVKFETLGCPAAIATSSVLTDLVKGKTLSEALKVKREDIVKSLGGLPKMKIHCSVLAIDALCEAIYDYFKRQKKPIPKEIQKRHQRIQREKKLIEEKYKEWLK